MNEIIKCKNCGTYHIINRHLIEDMHLTGNVSENDANNLLNSCDNCESKKCTHCKILNEHNKKHRPKRSIDNFYDSIVWDKTHYLFIRCRKCSFKIIINNLGTYKTVM